MKRIMAAFFVLCLGAGTAAADQVAQNLLGSGQSCDGYNTTSRNALLFYNKGVVNDSTSVRAEVSCPMNGLEGTDIDVKKVEVHTYDFNGSDYNSCRVYARSAGGTTYGGTMSNGSTGGIGVEVFTFNNPFNAGTKITAASGASFVVNCWIGKKTGSNKSFISGWLTETE